MEDENFNNCKSVKDLPYERQFNYIDVDGGFVRKDIGEEYLKEVLRATVHNDEELLQSYKDYLHQEACEINKEYEKSEDDLKEKIQAAFSFNDSEEFDERELDALRDDEGIVLKAVSTDDNSLEHASERLRNDLNFLIEVAKINPRALDGAPEDIKDFILK